jgi:hypothetical protein
MVISADMYSALRTEVRPPAIDLRLPLDDYLCILQPGTPHPTLSSLHGCLKWRGIGHLP